MAHILITSGPTRQYLDPVRFLTNASSGRMGNALANAALERGHKVTIVSGPVSMKYSDHARLIPVVSTDEMLAACQREFPACDGLIACAAPCDYQPRSVEPRKISKTGQTLLLELMETPDVVADLARMRTDAQWLVAFALETHDAHLHAMTKLQKKNCDLIILNDPSAIDASSSHIQILDRAGSVVASQTGPKSGLAALILQVVDENLIAHHPS